MPDHFVRLPHPGVAYMGLNLRRPPTDNVNFRKALASAIDMRAILDNVLNVPWRVEACGVIPPEIAGYQGCGNVGFEYDPVAAREYLRMAMEEMGIDDPGDISINFWGFRGVVEDVGELVIDQLETNLGIEVHAVSMEWAAYLETLSSCRH
jgi:ABC-type oligopeptide transport system substrate-binding subunit